MTEIQLLIVLQRQIGVAVLAAQLKERSRVLNVRGMMCGGSKPRLERIDQRRHYAEPAEPEHAELQNMGGVRNGSCTLIAQQDQQTVLDAVEERVPSAAEDRA